MDMIGCLLLPVLLLLMCTTLCRATGNSTGVLMRMYENDIKVKNHWEAILYCALIYPGISCSKMWWSHEIDLVTHVEENPEERSHTYRVKTELVKFTSRLEILTFSDNVTGPYTCQAKCGSNVYAVSCDVRDHPHANRSILCSERTFTIRENIISPKQEVHNGNLAENTPETRSNTMMTLTVVGVILAAIFLTAVLRWLTKRMQLKKHYRDVLLGITQHESHIHPSQPQPQPPPTSNLRPVSSTISRPMILPAVLPSLNDFFFGAAARQSDDVVYQSLPDGSQIVFIPRGKLPSYEAAVLSKKDGCGGRSSPPPLERRPTSGCSDSSSFSSEESLPPSYTTDQDRPVSGSGCETPAEDDDRNHDVMSPLTESSDANIPRAAVATRKFRNWTVVYPPPDYSD